VTFSAEPIDAMDVSGVPETHVSIVEG